MINYYTADSKAEPGWESRCTASLAPEIPLGVREGLTFGCLPVTEPPPPLQK